MKTTQLISTAILSTTFGCSAWDAPTGDRGQPRGEIERPRRGVAQEVSDRLERVAWNRIAWNRIAWNRIAWNQIDWENISPAESAWHQLRTDGLTELPLDQMGSDARLADALVDQRVEDMYRYIVECALPPLATVSYAHPSETDTLWEFTGLYGLAPGWESDAGCDAGCQRSVSACLLARINHHGERNIMTWRRGSGVPHNPHTDHMETPNPNVAASFELEEGAVWGNLFLRHPEVYVCLGADLDDPAATVPVGALRMCDGDPECLEQVYVGPCGGAGGVCAERRANEGYDHCAGRDGVEYTEVITIRRADFAVHADFVAGHAIDPLLSDCAKRVTEVEPACLEWFGDECVALTWEVCGGSALDEGEYGHRLDETGVPLSRDASTCTAYVCALDGSCCDAEAGWWDEECVELATTSCL